MEAAGRHTQDSEALAFQILALETASARLEALLDVDPDLGRFWRSATSLREACRSVGMEDILVLEGDVMLHDLENRALSAETSRGVAVAQEILAVLRGRNPILADGDPEAGGAAFLGLIGAGRFLGPAVSFPTGEDAEADHEGRGEISLPLIQSQIRSAVAQARFPLEAGLAAARVLREILPEIQPVSERLAFMLAEDAFRQTSMMARLDRSERAPLARWCYAPACALGTGRFRAWSVSTQKGLSDLLSGLQREIDRGLGSVPVYRAWREKAEALGSSPRRQSRYSDLLHAVPAAGVFSIGHMADRLDLSWHGARNLILKAQGDGLLTEVTWRRGHRRWAPPWLAADLRARSFDLGRGRRTSQIAASEGEGAFAQETAHRGSRVQSAIFDEENVIEALDEIDRALRELDKVMKRSAPTAG